MKGSGWSQGLVVTADGEGVVSHAGLAVLRLLADRSGLTGGLSRALATPRLLVHDRGRVLADVACAVAGGARAISDTRVLADQSELFGPVASVPTVWRTLEEFGAGGEHTRAGVTAAVNKARGWAWEQVEARHGSIPALRVADKTLPGVVGIRLDATVAPAHSDKQGAEGELQGFRSSSAAVLLRQHHRAAGGAVPQRLRGVEHHRRPPGSVGGLDRGVTGEVPAAG